MRIDLFVDDEAEPHASFEAPGTFELDTTGLTDGPHTLVVRARETEGAPGIETIPFSVRNGPGIAVFGLREGETVAGRVPILVNAYVSRVGDEFDPIRAETPAPVPTWAWVLSLVVAAWGVYYLTAEYRQHAAALAAVAPIESLAGPAREPTAADPREGALGAQVYGNYCAACHQQSGEGILGVFPPLRGDPVVTSEDSAEHIRVVLHGLSGKTIGGVGYAAAMPPFGAQLSDEQIAAVLSHERSFWGNAARVVTREEVAAARGASAEEAP